MHTLTITMATPAPPIVTDHADRATAVAALATYLTDRDCDPIANQITAAYESYDLICVAQQRVAATASIEPAPPTRPTDSTTVSDAERDRLDAGAPVCLEVRPGTLGYQLCCAKTATAATTSPKTDRPGARCDDVGAARHRRPGAVPRRPRRVRRLARPQGRHDRTRTTHPLSDSRPGRRAYLPDRGGHLPRADHGDHRLEIELIAADDPPGPGYVLIVRPRGRPTAPGLTNGWTNLSYPAPGEEPRDALWRYLVTICDEANQLLDDTRKALP